MTVLQDIHDDDNTIDTAEDLAPRKPRTKKSRKAILIVGLSLLVAAAPLAFLVRGRGLMTTLVRIVYPDYKMRFYAPKVLATTPGDGDVTVPVDATVSVDLKLSKCDVDKTTLNNKTVFLFRTGDQKMIPASVKVDGENLTLKPRNVLEPLTNYTFYITPALKDTRAQAATPFAMSFTTAGQADPDIRFQKVALANTKGNGFTALKIGPDGKLWCGTDNGRIIRYEIASDGTLGDGQEIKSLQEANHGPRILLGFTFDAKSTADNPIIWVTHSYFSFTRTPDFTGRVTRMSGKNLERVEDVVINLPRAIKDHQTMQPSFGPDGALYFSQASNSAMGAPDSEWGNREEHMLNACILRLDTSKVTPGKPIDAKTKDCGGKYDPFAPDAPLTIYATGVRLAYDLCWHSNGHLYAPTNGSSAGGNTPEANGLPALKEVNISEDDWLLKIEPGMYYGHPIPPLGHYVLNGGNPTDKWDWAEIVQYPVGTKPDPKYTKAVWDMGRHISADGCVEYRSDHFNGKLKGKLLICRYNWGSDLIAIGFDENGDVNSAEIGFPGMGNFQSPLDVTEDVRTGNLYVSEYGAQLLTLLRPVESGQQLNNVPEQIRTRSTKQGSEEVN